MLIALRRDESRKIYTACAIGHFWGHINIHISITHILPILSINKCVHIDNDGFDVDGVILSKMETQYFLIGVHDFNQIACGR